MNEREITVKALNQLEFHTGLVAKVTEHTNLSAHHDHTERAFVEFSNTRNNAAPLVAQLKHWKNDNNAKAIINQICATSYSTTKILISDYIDDSLGTQLRQAKINYLDKVGNAYLDINSVFVLIEGKTPAQKIINTKAERLFTETGMKVICALLTNTNLLNANYRTIADHANVSMGTIGWVLRELKDQEFTQEDHHKRKWLNKTSLMKTWIAKYSKLIDKNLLGTYYTKNENWWKNIELEYYGAILGGSIAASHCGYAIAKNEGIIYVGKHQDRPLVRELDLIKGEGINENNFARVEIRSKFWGQTERLGLFENHTHPLITCADLKNTWEPIKIDIANKIAEQYLSN